MMRVDRACSFPLELAVVAGLFAVVTTEIFVTYSRLPTEQLYHVSKSGIAGGASRVLVFWNFPVALVAIAVLALVADRLARPLTTALAAVGVLLSAAVFWPGVVKQSDLDVRAVNAIADAGLLIAVVLAGFLAARGVTRLRWRGGEDAARVIVAGAVLVLAVPWLVADLGFSFNGVPVLGTLYQSGELRRQPMHVVTNLRQLETPPHPAVHHGHHHGMDGVLLVLSALLLSRLVSSVRRRWLRIGLGLYLALMLSYGFGEIANDFWLEQVVKRGWTTWQIPDVTVPKVTVAWGIVLLGAVAVFALAAWRARRAADAWHGSTTVGTA